VTDSDLPPLSSQDEAALRARLDRTPRPEIPAAVSQRVFAAIHKESATRAEHQGAKVVGLRERRGLRVLAAAASVAVIGLVGVAVLPSIIGSSPNFAAQSLNACTVSAEPSADLTPVMHSSGERYGMNDFSDLAMDVMAEPAAECDKAEDVAGGVVGTKPIDADMFTATMSEVRFCVVSEMMGRPIHVADSANFEGQPALVVVAGSPKEVVALECNGVKSAVLARKTMGD
jgi:hypothetical protein